MGTDPSTHQHDASCVRFRGVSSGLDADVHS